ncbi:hypothetical protein D3874_22285 [Oleomonas cavernae]|uniref:DUF1302 domain-containing protein n=1 Tax=Oleomonas cavernae TaxID=2320859 RepID=A0A418WH53_9PROT|nr:hypothetical protein [Oleomonas cavernae]RJF89363.1 hypothetical protein D3874_22285 [Oleomonas cavernae]
MTIRKVFLATTIIGGAIGATLGAFAYDLDNFTVGGRVKQGISFGYADITQDMFKIAQMNYIAEVDTSWKPSKNVAFTGNFWLRGDWFDSAGGDLLAGGIQDYNSPGFRDQFGYHINRRGGARGSQDQFGNTVDHQNRYLDDFEDEMIREFAVKITDDNNRFAFKVGKFVRGWGQSDGIRLLDVLHAQDLRMKGVLGDSDEIRIPSWMATVDLNFDEMGIGKPFEWIGLTKPGLELVFMPEHHKDEFIINNPTPTDTTSGGLYGFPFPYLIDPESGQGIPFFAANLHDVTPREFSVTDATVAARFKFQALHGEGTLNAYYGWQELPIIKMRDSVLYVGSPNNDPNEGILPGTKALQVPLSQPLLEDLVHARGIGYLSALRAVQFLNSGPLGALLPAPVNPYGCSLGIIGPLCSVTTNFDLDYRYRKKLLGATFTRDMVELAFGPKDVAPVFRMEASYEFDKPFNRYRVTTSNGQDAHGSPALISSVDESVTFRDQISVMVGFDYFLWLPFWENQESSIFTSFQLFNIITDESKDLMFQSPYAAFGSKVHPVQTYATFLWWKGLDDGRLYLEGLAAYDFQNEGFAYRQRVDFNYFGDSIRPRLEWIHYEGKTEQGLFGLYDNADAVELSLTYQF